MTSQMTPRPSPRQLSQLQLSQLQPFARGGNRLCYVHPGDASRCIKVRRPDFTLADRRRQKGFPKNLKPLSSFDDNAEEYRVMQQLDRRFGEALYAHVSRCFGFEATDFGPGLCSELIRNADGPIAQTLKQHLWLKGLQDDCQQALARFCTSWEKLAIPSRDLLLHNLVVQCDADGQVHRLVLIDGLGSGSLIPTRWLPTALQKRKAARKTADLWRRIQQLLAQDRHGELPGYHGQLFHDGLNPPPERETPHD